jgi:hypothetical protein
MGAFMGLSLLTSFVGLETTTGLFDVGIVNGTIHGVDVGLLSLEDVVCGRCVRELVGTMIVGELVRALELIGRSVVVDNGASVWPFWIGMLLYGSTGWPNGDCGVRVKKGALVAGDDDVDGLIATVG